MSATPEKPGMGRNENTSTATGGSDDTDRYISFAGIDCNGNARRVMESIERNLAGSGQSGPFWEYFMAKRKPRSGPPPDDLFLVHCHINQIRELFDSTADEEALALLSLLEEECC